ncbi:MAG: hypothetical protein HC855_11275 [Rhizobiales bacterium]|nr:hypothetical protein [Hyphomicrobiales bacterium]
MQSTLATAIPRPAPQIDPVERVGRLVAVTGAHAIILLDAITTPTPACTTRAQKSERCSKSTRRCRCHWRWSRR